MFKNNMFIEYNNVQYKGISFIVFKLNELKRSADTIRKQQKLLFFLKKKKRQKHAVYNFRDVWLPLNIVERHTDSVLNVAS